MSTGNDTSDTARLSPGDAFAVLGNEHRIQILQALGEADRALPFSELYDRVDVRDSGNFSYHLDQLKGHFVRQGEDGYVLRQAGRRVVEAILSGAVTESPVVEPTEIEKPCSYCGTPIVLVYQEEQVRKYCSDCRGTYGRRRDPGEAMVPADYGYLGSLDLPSAGVHQRSPMEVLEAAYTWSLHEHFAWAAGVCPRCSASVEHTLRLCKDHDASGQSCPHCDGTYAVHVVYRCPTCYSDHEGMFANHLLTCPELLLFLIAHDVNPLSPPPTRFSAAVWVYEEEVMQTDPFRARFTFTVDGDSLTLEVDDELTVVDVSEGGSTQST